MTEVPDYVPMLIKGFSPEPQEGGCLVQIANWLADPRLWTDEAVCVDQILASWGITINDVINDEMRHRLALCAPRIADTKITDRDERNRVHRGLSLWMREGAGSGHPTVVHPSGTKFTGATNSMGALLTILHPVIRLTGGDEYAVQWYEALVDEYDRLVGRGTRDALAPERWQEVKELVGQ